MNPPSGCLTSHSTSISVNSVVKPQPVDSNVSVLIREKPQCMYSDRITGICTTGRNIFQLHGQSNVAFLFVWLYTLLIGCFGLLASQIIGHFGEKKNGSSRKLPDLIYTPSIFSHASLLVLIVTKDLGVLTMDFDDTRITGDDPSISLDSLMGRGGYGAVYRV